MFLLLVDAGPFIVVQLAVALGDDRTAVGRLPLIVEDRGE
jgi:hypothetical protein